MSKNEVAVATHGLTKRYGSVSALADLDLEIRAGEIFGYLGPNGAGKTTTIRLLLGLSRPTDGSATVFGKDCWSDAVEVHRRISYVPGDVNLWPSLTGMETLSLLGNVQGRVDVSYRDDLIGRFELDTSKKVRAYSRGNRQKVVLIAALMSRSDLLVLDEPTAGLDPLMEQEFRRCVHEAKERGQTILLSSHILSEVEALCDRVAILRDGRLVEVGTLSEMRHLSSVTVEVTVVGEIPDLSGIDGVTAVQIAGQRIHCQVHGSIDPLLKALSSVTVTSLLSREPSLEELFLALYGEDGSERRIS